MTPDDPLDRAERFAARFRERGAVIPAPLRRAIRVLSAVPPHVRPRLSGALCVIHRELEPVFSLPFPSLRYEGPLCPAYPRLVDGDAQTARVAARLALGQKPARVLAGLTAREAHRALSVGVTDPVAWLVCHPSLADEDIDPGSVRSVPVARWLLACRADPARWDALTRPRTSRGPHGETIEGRLLDRIDEVRAQDLSRGPATGVDAAFEAAAKRAYDAWCREAERQHQPMAAAPTWWRPIRCAGLLLSAAELVAEGREMRHCVGTYAPYVRRGSSVIVSICLRARDGVHRSTVEVDRSSGRVLQHRGVGNAAPPRYCAHALRVCRARWFPTSKGQSS
ncbi:MAG: PcfJ domain-containing protein [Polyangiaceae bacterium]|nr:PcfJ domain-containing protein [Polyangiaceae bacterium]